MASGQISKVVGALLVCVCLPLVVDGRGFMQVAENAGDDAKAIHADIQRAMEGTLGCGGHIRDDQMPNIETALAPMWRSLPKNSHGRIERSMLRYVAHRYFMRQSSLMIRGLEPTRKLNESESGSAQILGELMPGLVETVLEAEHFEDHGFGMREVAHVIAIIEELIWDSESALLEKVYTRSGRALTDAISHEDLLIVLEDYMLYWLLGDQDDMDSLLANRTAVAKRLRNQAQFSHLANGLITGLEYRRQHVPGRNGIDDLFSFDDAHGMVGEMTKSWGHFYESECNRLRQPLLNLDKDNTGRAPLARFYAAGGGFQESEEYLREVGALEENGHSGGKKVLVANYLQAASNCIVSTSHYHVCCQNHCESMLGDIEAAMASPVAQPADILAFVRNMSATDITLDRPLELSKALVAQLGSIATKHNGLVPLHGRRFAQWLHYVFPRECPFPHKLGTVSSVKHTEWGNGPALLPLEERKRLALQYHAEDQNRTKASTWNFETHWSSDEELLADYGSELEAPWERRGSSSTIGVMLCLLASAALGSFAWKARGQKAFEFELPSSTKQHMV